MVFRILKDEQTNNNNQTLSIPEKQDISIKRKNHGKRGFAADSYYRLFVN
jgi:hypothetical protein